MIFKYILCYVLFATINKIKIIKEVSLFMYV